MAEGSVSFTNGVFSASAFDFRPRHYECTLLVADETVILLLQSQFSTVVSYKSTTSPSDSTIKSPAQRSSLMKYFIAITFAALAALSFAPSRTSAQNVIATFNTLFDQANTSMSTAPIACAADLSPRFPTFISVPTWPAIGGSFFVGGAGSQSCGACFGVSNAADPETFITFVVIDRSETFTLSEESMRALGGDAAVEAGELEVNIVGPMEMVFCNGA